MIAMMNTFSGASALLWDTLGMEAFLLIIFGLGYLVFNTPLVQKLVARPDARDALLGKQMAADLASGNYSEVLRRAGLLKSVNLETLSLVMSALVELGQTSEAWARAKEVLALPSRTPEMIHACFEVLAGDATVLAEARQWVEEHCGPLDVQSLQILVVAFADAMQVEQVKSLLALGAQCPPKAFVLLVKAALKQGQVDAACDLLRDMHGRGLQLPVHVLAQLLRASAKLGLEDTATTLFTEVGLGADALGGLLEACAKDGQPRLADKVRASAPDVAVPRQGFEALIKLHARQNDPRAFALLDEMQACGLSVSTGLCVSVASCCVESRNVPLAEHVLSYARMAGTANLTLYSTLVKVYAATRQFEKTCELCATLHDDGLEPDTIMYGGLIKAAVECGQLELSRKLLKQSGTMDIQNYMSLFRACGRERNVRKCLDLLGELEASDVGIDTTAYNCVLDVCLKSGDVRQGTALFAKMKTLGFVDVISYNTLLKSARAGPLDAMSILEDMRSRGLVPNQVTYNSLLNVCVSKGDMAQAWRFVAEMEQHGVAVDNFTCSTMMKGLKFKSSKDDVDKTLGLIERSRVCPDEVLVSTLLDACIRLRDVKRLTQALNTFRLSGVVPSEQSYGTLIRAYGQARCIDQCVQLWHDMLERKVKPTDPTFQSMLEACVSNGALDAALAAVADMRKHRPSFKAPAATYQTLIKGFAVKKEALGAVAVYRDMQAQGVPLDRATWNCLIDAVARVGDVEQAGQFFRDMCAEGVVPNLVTYSTVIKGYCVQGDLEQAVQLFMMMRKRGVQPDATLFNAILDGCARKQMTSMSEMMLADMETSGVAPTSLTLSILVKLYGKAHDLESALQLMERFPRQYGVEVSAQVQQALLQACLSNERMEQACTVFKQMRPDSKACTLFITGCLKNQDVARAVATLQQALEQGCAIENDLAENVVFMAQRRKMDTAAVVSKLQAKGYTVAAQPAGNSPRGQAEQHSKFHARRQQSQQWRDSTSDSE